MWSVVTHRRGSWKKEDFPSYREAWRKANDAARQLREEGCHVYYDGGVKAFVAWPKGEDEAVRIDLVYHGV